MPIAIPVIASPLLYCLNNPIIPNRMAKTHTGIRNHPRKGIKLKTKPVIASPIEIEAAEFVRFSTIKCWVIYNESPFLLL